MATATSPSTAIRAVLGVPRARLILRRGALGVAFAQPRAHDRVAPANPFVVRVVAIPRVGAEQPRDPLAVVRPPRLDVAGEPAVDLTALHAAITPQPRERRQPAPDGDPTHLQLTL